MDLIFQRKYDQLKVQNEQLRAQLRKARQPMVMIEELRKQGIEVEVEATTTSIRVVPRETLAEEMKRRFYENQNVQTSADEGTDWQP